MLKFWNLVNKIYSYNVLIYTYSILILIRFCVQTASFTSSTQIYSEYLFMLSLPILTNTCTCDLLKKICFTSKNVHAEYYHTDIIIYYVSQL